MDTHTQTLQQELNRRWLAFGPETQECLIYLARTFTGDQGLDDLPHYQEALERQDQYLAERYTTFGQVAVGDHFFHFGHEYEKTEPAQVLQWVNCQSDRGRCFMGDGFVVERVESQKSHSLDLDG